MIKECFDRFRGTERLPSALRNAGTDAELVEDQEFLANCRNWRKEPVYRDEELDVVVRGGVDDLLKTMDGEFIVLDYKTRGSPPSDEAPDCYQRQLSLYNLILQENGYMTADYGYLLYYTPDKILDSGEFVFNTELQKVETDIENAQDLVISAVIRLQGPIPDVNDDCEFCRWNQTDHTA